MRFSCSWLILSVVFFPAAAPAASEAKPPPTYAEARLGAWIFTSELVKTLDEGDAKQWPGTHDWLKDLREQTKGVGKDVPPEKWPKVDIGALVDHDPNFWRMYFEIAPGDPMLTTIHAGLLLSQGEALRAAYVVELGRHRPGVPKEYAQAFRMLQNSALAALKPSEAATEEGTRMFDQGDEKEEEAIRLGATHVHAHTSSAAEDERLDEERDLIVKWVPPCNERMPQVSRHGR
jgi:hypothetical protein